MQREYLEGEIEAWSQLIRDPANPKFVLRCSRGHMLESPIALSQPETDQVCMKCENS
jgi:hypothetical protein